MGLAKNQNSVLEILEATDAEMTAADIADAIGGLARSSAYSAVGALQRMGLITARWDHSSYPRRLLGINDEGRQSLARERMVRTAITRLAPRGAT